MEVFFGRSRVIGKISLFMESSVLLDVMADFVPVGCAANCPQAVTLTLLALLAAELLRRSELYNRGAAAQASEVSKSSPGVLIYEIV